MFELKKENVENQIYEIRGKLVMLDSDLAKLYECTNGTKTINQAVSRHLDRFPSDFYFQLTEEEYNNISRSQVGTLKIKRGQNMKYLPHVFTEQGVAMLSSVLRTEISSKVSINIMRAFVAMRHYIGNNLIEQKYINNLVLEDHERLGELENSFNKFEEKKKINEIYFNGQIFDAYSKILDIFKEASDELIVIDNYADNNLLDIIKKLRINVILITTNKYISNEIIDRYNKQYSNLKVIFNNTFHDRYFILDKRIIYHCGASINRIGYKTFSINLINDEIAIKSLIDNVNEILLTIY